MKCMKISNLTRSFSFQTLVIVLKSLREKSYWTIINMEDKNVEAMSVLVDSESEYSDIDSSCQLMEKVVEEWVKQQNQLIMIEEEESMDKAWLMDSISENEQDQNDLTIVSSRLHEEEHLVSCCAAMLADKISTLIRQHCYGCQNDHPSQIQLDKCMMMSQQEKLDEYLVEAWSLISEQDILQAWYKGLREQLCPPLFASEIMHIKTILARSKESKYSQSYLTTEDLKLKVWCELRTQHFL